MQGFSFYRPRFGLVILLVVLFASACGFTGSLSPNSASELAGLPTLAALPSARAITPSSLPVLPTVTPARPTVLPTAEPTRTVPPTSTPEPEPSATPVPSFDPALAAELQRILKDIVADGSIPGAVLSVYIPGQEPWVGASGFVDRQQSQPIAPATQMRIASISKVFTAVVVLQLMEEGKLDLDTPVSTWFPQLVPHADKTTVRRLLNHTTGLYDYLEDKHYLAEAYQVPDHHWAPDELVTYAASRPSAFRPGAHGAWDYSSTNYVLLGMIVEQVTGNSLAQEMHQRIFIPLGLKHTYFPPDDPVQGVQARGYRHANDQTNLSLSFAFATANLVSTVDDVRRFGEALFGGRLLKPETLDLMYIFENGKGQYNMPALEYGLGVMRNILPVGPDADGRKRPATASQVLGHTGGFGGFRSALWHAPESGITIALGMNQGATDPNILATRVFQAILRWEGR